MKIIIKHNIKWYEGGIEIDEIISKFADRMELEDYGYGYTLKYITTPK